MASFIKTVGVLGTGVIGSSWTTLFLSKGLRVIISDPAPGAEERLGEYIQKEWSNMEKIGLSPSASPKNWKFVHDVADHLDEIDFLQENAPERLDFKSKLFATLDEKARPDLILASSSSGIPSLQFIKDCKKAPERVLIGHPFNPPHLVPLVEVVPHPKTLESITQKAMEFYVFLGKRPILVKQEVPGFVANRLQAAIGNEAYSLVQRGIVSASDLDSAVTTGLGVRWALTGPLMTNVLGGGGGKEGFTHFLEHLAPAVQAWTKDMENHKFEYTDANIRILSQRVSEWLDRVDIDELERERDLVLLALLKMKREEPALV